MSQEFADLCRKFEDRGKSGAGLVLTNVSEQILFSSLSDTSLGPTAKLQISIRSISSISVRRGETPLANPTATRQGGIC